MVFSFEYSPFVFLPNFTTCGYINVHDPYWESKSCSTEFSRKHNTVTCRCKHMSYYSVIDDFLVRPTRIPLLVLFFKNGASLSALLYVLILFIVGVIYTVNKDNEDFRFLHEEEKAQGNELRSDNSVALVSLAFKRKVFFMNFGEKYRLSSLFSIYVLLLHPLFQLKYRMDPQMPRYYRFLLLWTRIVLLLALSFFLLRDYKNFDRDTSLPHIIALVLFCVIGSLLLVPLPIPLFNPVRSKYYLVDPKAKPASDNENGAEEDDDTAKDNGNMLVIDTSIPIKLLFILNSVSHEKLAKSYGDVYAYATGDPVAVGEKLWELDVDIQTEILAAQKKKKETLPVTERPLEPADT